MAVRWVTRDSIVRVVKKSCVVPVARVQWRRRLGRGCDVVLVEGPLWYKAR